MIDPKTKFDHDLTCSIDTFVDGYRQENHDDARIIALTFFVQKLFTNKSIAI